MASWKEERDRLVAQTLAFVQQVAAAHPVAASKLIGETTEPMVVTVPPAAPEPAPAPEIAERILDALPPRVAHYASASERTEISERVAAFKERQLLLNREREAYYETVQARIRSSLRNQSEADRL